MGAGGVGTLSWISHPDSSGNLASLPGLFLQAGSDGAFHTWKMLVMGGAGGCARECETMFQARFPSSSGKAAGAFQHRGQFPVHWLLGLPWQCGTPGSLGEGGKEDPFSGSPQSERETAPALGAGVREKSRVSSPMLWVNIRKSRPGREEHKLGFMGAPEARALSCSIKSP